jgi:uncharacterized protein
MRTSNYVIYVGVPERDRYYIMHGYTGAVDEVSPEVIHFLLAHSDTARTGLRRDEQVIRECVRDLPGGPLESGTLESLASRGYLIDKSAEQEREYVERLATVLHARDRRRAQPGFLLVPSYSCNLRCTYCYQHELRRFGEVMSRETVDAAFKTMEILRETHGAGAPVADGAAERRWSLGLYGGEPLWRATEAIVRYIVGKGRERNASFSAVTNGIDLNLFADLLGPEGIQQLQITLDGPKELHNSKRIGAKYKQGTYDTIVGNIRLALERDAAVAIRVHVDWNSIDRTGDLMGELEALGLLAHPKLTVYAETIHSWMAGHASPHHPGMAQADLHERLDVTCPTATKALRATDHGVSARLRRYVEYGLAGIGNRVNTCPSQTAMYILDVFRDIYPCWEIVGDRSLAIGRFSADGPIFNSREREWRDRSPAMIDECARCKYAMLHFGGCAAIPLRTCGSVGAPACYDYEDAFIALSRRFFAEDRIPATTNAEVSHG